MVASHRAAGSKMKNSYIFFVLFVCCSICLAEPSKDNIKLCEKTATFALAVAQKRDEKKTLEEALGEIFKGVKSAVPETIVTFASDIYESPGVSPTKYAIASYDVCYAKSDPSILPEEYYACLAVSDLVGNVAKGRKVGMTLEEVRSMVTPKEISIEKQLDYASISKFAFDMRNIESQGMKDIFFSDCYRRNIRK